MSLISYKGIEVQQSLTETVKNVNSLAFKARTNLSGAKTLDKY